MPAILHIELVEQTADALQLRLWRDNPNALQTRTLALSEIVSLVGVAESEYYSPSQARLRDVGEQLFRWLDGGERWLTREIQASANGAPVLVLAIALPHRLAHLPWEVLHDGATFLLHAPNPPVLPVRWKPSGSGAHAPQNRPLQVLFMASSPKNVRPVLDYEREEAAILQATARRGLDLFVEESGCLEELGELVRDYDANHFDVLHLTGHASHGKNGVPVFELEDSVGQRADASAAAIAKALPHRPPLVFLSGCRTGQNPAHGEVRSLAEQLLGAGFRAVLGWGRPVLDTDAILAAQHLYAELAAGVALPLALIQAHRAMLQEQARDWHLLRLFCAGDPCITFVTPARAPGRKRSVSRIAESEFLDPLTKNVKVATRAGFIGRRRLLQRSLRQLRGLNSARLGLLLHGQGGRGKSSVAARLCERLRHDFQRVVVIGRLDEASFLNAWELELPDEKHRQILRNPSSKLRFQIEHTLQALADAGQNSPLFVLDDFEQNQPGQEQGDLRLAPHAAAVLQALFDAIGHTGLGRVLMTCRFALPSPFEEQLHAEDVPPLDENEQKKQMLRLDQKAERKTQDNALLAQAVTAADGNPRLFEWLHQVLERPGLDHAAILAEMQQAEERFREDILARHLIASLPEQSRVLLGRLLMLNLPVPFAAVQSLDPSQQLEPALNLALNQAAALSLLDTTMEDGQSHYRVPHQLGSGNPPLLPVPDSAERIVFAAQVFEVLHHAWLLEKGTSSEPRLIELIRLAAEGRRKKELIALARIVTNHWLDSYRCAETAALLEPLLDLAERHYSLLMNLARAKQMLGFGDASGLLFKEAVGACPTEEAQELILLLLHHTEWLSQRGELDELLGVCREQLIPLTKRTNDDYHRAATMGQIADVLAARGELDEALRIYQEEELPVYKQLGDMRELAATMGKIADVLAARGELDEALRIYQEEELPIYKQLGDMRKLAVTMGKIADVLAARGELDEALRIYQEEVLPAFKRLGDVRSLAVTIGKIADVLAARGELDEALRIRREEELPVYKQLGNVRELAITMDKIADALATRGELDEALRIRQEEVLPAFKQLGDVRSLMATIGKVADLLAVRGELDEALRIYQEEVLPAFKRLGDVRSLTVTIGKIADVLTARGELDEALRIRQEEELPVYKQLGDVRELIVSRAKLAMLLLNRGREEDVPEALEHLKWAYQASVQRGYKEAGQIASILKQLGLLQAD